MHAREAVVRHAAAAAELEVQPEPAEGGPASAEPRAAARSEPGPRDRSGPAGPPHAKDDREGEQRDGGDDMHDDEGVHCRV